MKIVFSIASLVVGVIGLGVFFKPVPDDSEVPGLCRLPDPQNGVNAPSREIFLQKE